MHPRQESVKFNHHPHAPSFSSYSSNGDLIKIAARVTGELPALPEPDDFDKENNDEGDDEEDEFEFDLANLIPSESEIGPVYPVFDGRLLKDSDIKRLDEKKKEKTVMIELEKLFIQDDDDRETPCSSSSSEADELDGLPPGSYCAWTPTGGSAAPSPSRCVKSNSTGSTSKPWRLRDLLLKRSKSDGKEGLVLLAPKQKKKGAEKNKKGEARTKKTKAVVAAKATEAARGVYYGTNKDKEKNKRKSYLPYKRDLLGFFTAPQGLRITNYPPL